MTKLYGVAGIAALAIVAGLAWLLYVNRQKFNPLNPDNLANQGASAVVGSITGGAAAGGEDTVGGVFARLREAITGDDAAIEAMKSGAPARAVKPVLTPAEMMGF